MQLYEVIAGVLKIEPDTLCEESNALNTPNWDSLSHIDLILAVETAFNTHFSMSEMVSMQNLGDMRQLLLSKGVDLGEGRTMRLSA